MTKTETKSIKKTKRKFINIKIINSCLLVSIILCGAFYMVSVNDLIIKGFELQELKKEYNKISEDTVEHELKILALESNNNLSKRAEKLEMVAIGEMEFISVSGGVAMK